MLLSVIVPCYNEARTIREILALVRQVVLDKEIIVVDDHSSDQSYRLLQSEAENDKLDGFKALVTLLHY